MVRPKTGDGYLKSKAHCTAAHRNEVGSKYRRDRHPEVKYASYTRKCRDWYYAA